MDGWVSVCTDTCMTHLTWVLREVCPVVLPASYAAGHIVDVSTQQPFQHLVSAVHSHIVECASICWSRGVKGIDVYILQSVGTCKPDSSCV